MLLSEVSVEKSERLQTGPWDLCFGGGLVSESVVLIGGAPGAGKSTLMLQIAEEAGSVLYLAAEEAPEQIKERADRLGISGEAIHIWPTLGGETVIEAILDGLETYEIEPDLIIADSLPGMAGDNHALQSEICISLKNYAIENKCPALIIDHITKELEFAGRIALQHLVDATISFYPDEKTGKRVLKPVKNRHGAVGTSSVFDMRETGLVHLHDTLNGVVVEQSRSKNVEVGRKAKSRRR